jgi:putative tryptophan/tyrosine transport system substrate-binding protein
MDRRTFIGTLTGSLLAAPLAAGAQQARSVGRLGLLAPGLSHDTSRSSVLIQTLQELGYVPNQSLLVERRFAEGKIERLPAMAAELVQLKVDVLFTVSTPGVRAAQSATTTIPIVFVGVSDPVGSGVVLSLARPGANTTGVSTQLTDLNAKELQLLKEILPRARRVAVLWNPANQASTASFAESEQVASTLNITIVPVRMANPADVDTALAAMMGDRPDAMLVHPTAPMFEVRGHLMEFAASNRLPTISYIREMAVAGGLVTYGPDAVHDTRLAAGYVDRILKGAKPADLPVIQPTKFELVINLKTAKALGLTIPPSLLHRADQVIE